MSRFELFVGLWNTSGDVLATDLGPAGELIASDEYRWLPGRHFMLHQVDARFGKEASRSIEVMGIDHKTRKPYARSFDDKGVSEVFALELRARRWKILGDSVRFDGRFSADASRLTGLWEVRGPKNGWQPWIQLLLERA